MSERLSSSWTTFHKTVPALLSGGSVLGAATSILSPGARPLGGGLIAVAFVSFVAFLYARRLRVVDLVGHCLVVSDGNRAVHIHASRIVGVRQTHWQNPAVVTITFREGSSEAHVSFIPKSFLVFTLEDSPIVERLRELSNDNSPSGCGHFA